MMKSEKKMVEATMGPRQEQKYQTRVESAQNGYKKMKEQQQPKRFNIYGKDAEDFETESEVSVEKHSPVWSNVRKGKQIR